MSKNQLWDQVPHSATQVFKISLKQNKFKFKLLYKCINHVKVKKKICIILIRDGGDTSYTGSVLQ